MRFIRNICTLMIKEWRSLFADPVMLALMLVVFTGVIYNIGKGINVDVRNAPVGIIDEDRSALTRQIAAGLQAPYFREPLYIEHDEADALLDKSKVIFVLAFPPNFTHDVLAGRAPDVQLLVDATAMTQAGIGQAYIARIVAREVQQYLGLPDSEAQAAVLPALRLAYNPNSESVWFVPVMKVGDMIALMALVLAGAAVIREREHGTMEHLLVMPIGAVEILLAKILANGSMILCAALLSMNVVVNKLLGAPLQGSQLLYAAGIVIFLFSMASLGVMLATFAPSMPQFGLLMLPVYITMLLFSGSAAPRSNMPQAAQLLSEYWPTTQFAQFAQKVLFRGADAAVVWPEMVVMAGIGAVFLLMALWRFKKMLERQG